MDDYGLDVYAFRLVCHIARRGKCFSSVPTIAQTCKFKVQTIRKKLKELTALNVLKAHHRKGATTEYSLNPIERWNPSTTGTGVCVDPICNGTAPPPILGRGHPICNGTDKGNPTKGNPLKGEAAPKLFPRELKEAIKDREEAIRSLKQDFEFERNDDRARLIQEDISHFAQELRELKKQYRGGYELKSKWECNVSSVNSGA
jgi:hypothetical protein